MAKITFITIRKTFLVYSPKKNLKRKFCEEMSQFWFNQERNWTVRALVQSNYPQNWCLWFPRKKKKGINKKWTKRFLSGFVTMLQAINSVGKTNSKKLTSFTVGFYYYFRWKCSDKFSNYNFYDCVG